MAVSMKLAVFWAVAPCRLVWVYLRFKGPYCSHHQGDKSTAREIGANKGEQVRQGIARRHPATCPGVTHKGTTLASAQVDTPSSPAQRRKKTPTYVSGVRYTLKFLELILSSSSRNLVPCTVPSGRTRVWAFMPFPSRRTNTCVCCWKHLCKRIQEAEIREELETLHVSVQRRWKCQHLSQRFGGSTPWWGDSTVSVTCQ
jgi:hypothetical protein